MALRSWAVEEICAVTGGRALAAGTGAVSGLSLDSRAVRQGNLFAAIRGERADGHAFCRAAAAAGAAALLVETEVEAPEGTGVVLVGSVPEALKALGKAARSKFRGEVVGVVGSCGKTTTKDFAAAVLSKAMRVSSTEGNLNNLLGLPVTLMNADAGAEALVLELGISKPSEMGELAPIAAPTGVVFTTIQPVHTEFLPTLEAIRDEKVSVLESLAPGGFVAVNEDDPLLRDIAVPEGARRLSYGEAPEAGLRLEVLGEDIAGGTRFILSRGEERAEGLLPLPGRHQALNFAAACAAGLAAGVSLALAISAASALRPAAHRGEVHRLRGGALLLDDSYNSNPAAASAVLEEASRWGRPVVAVLGEMRELGADSRRFHEDLGALAARVGVAALACVGGDDAAAMRGAFGVTGRPCRNFRSWREAGPWILTRIDRNCLLVVKGSRAVGLEGLVSKILEEEA